MTWDHTTSLQSDNVKDISEIKESLMVEAEVTKNNKTIGKLEYDSLYLLNDAKNILQDKSLESFRDDDENMDEIVGKVLLLNTKLLKK